MPRRALNFGRGASRNASPLGARVRSSALKRSALTLVPMLRVGMHFVTLRVTILCRTAH
ncbi:DUF1534 domain-containing protein [Pseudomonas syringae]|nr:DUF1534 domain-containing protein [Pseudomonas syringae]MCF5489442.1 DUF1534 domain-containing protein [Pseudomonas syringae]MCF5496815.1 DUF1534 domain-containing protein [Pseudomonas syringae]MCF5525703.1 DUF1534 domain-containing protein [Pseudomonas syringae]MCF5529679.1 DUF1534 domain-containing protein [Pseudomonas syringae]